MHLRFVSSGLLLALSLSQRGNLRILLPAGATYIFHHFCLNLKDLNILCFPLWALLWVFTPEGLYSVFHNIYLVLMMLPNCLCFCVINIGIRYALRLLIHLRANDLQLHSGPSYLPVLSSLVSRYRRHIFRLSHHRQIFLQKHLLLLILSLASAYPKSFSRTIVHSRSCSCICYLSAELQNKHII